MATVLSLFDYTGNWAKPYKEQGHTIIQVDIKLGTDIFSFNYKGIDKPQVILMAPPCTHFSVSGAQYWKAKDVDGRTQEALSLVEKGMEIINYFQPSVWALENPVGRLNKLAPGLAEFGPWYFQPWEFGDAWTKKTGLWGKFIKPEKSPIEPVRSCKQGSWIQQLGGKSERTKELRSATPMGFAYAFAAANPV
ncbi:MAG: DNA cytosine methyltransferase [Candidatus Thorarchaeota archaeon]